MTSTSESESTGKYRLLHTMIRVKDLDRSIDFYTRLLGMRVIRHKDFEGGRFTNVFVGYGDEDSETVLELTHNWDQDEPYSHGSGFGHLAVGVPDIYATCAALTWFVYTRSGGLLSDIEGRIGPSAPQAVAP